MIGGSNDDEGFTWAPFYVGDEEDVIGGDAAGEPPSSLGDVPEPVVSSEETAASAPPTPAIPSAMTSLPVPPTGTSSGAFDAPEDDTSVHFPGAEVGALGAQLNETVMKALERAQAAGLISPEKFGQAQAKLNSGDVHVINVSEDSSSIPPGLSKFVDGLFDSYES